MWPESSESCPGSGPPPGNYRCRGTQSQPGPWQKKKDEGKGKALTLSSFTTQDPVSHSPKPMRSQRSKELSPRNQSGLCSVTQSKRSVCQSTKEDREDKEPMGRSKHIMTCTPILLMPGSTVTSITSRPRVRSQHDLGYSLLKSKIWRKGLSCKKGTVKFC